MLKVFFIILFTSLISQNAVAGKSSRVKKCNAALHKLCPKTMKGAQKRNCAHRNLSRLPKTCKKLFQNAAKKMAKKNTSSRVQTGYENARKIARDRKSRKYNKRRKIAGAGATVASGRKLMAKNYQKDSKNNITYQKTSTSPTVSLISLGLFILWIVAFWKLFEKAGESGWKSLIPIYSAIILMKIVGRPGWWIILMMIPIVGIIVSFMVSIGLAKKFNHSALYGIGLVLLGPLLWYHLGFSDSQYQVSGNSLFTA